MPQVKPTVTIAGNVGQLHELKFSKQGKAVLKFSIAVNDRTFKDGEWVDGDTSWFDITCFGALAEGLSDASPKGKRVLIHGNVKKNLWEDKNGVKHSNVEVIADEIGIIPFRSKGQQRVIRQDQLEGAPF